MGSACGAKREWEEYGKRIRLAVLSREAVVKVMAIATEKMSCSLVWGVGLGEQEEA